MKCIKCNTEFEGRADAKFCSPKCRVAYSRNKKREGIPPCVKKEIAAADEKLMAMPLPPEVTKPDFKKVISKAEFPASKITVIPSSNPRLEPIVEGLASHPDIKAVLEKVPPAAEPDLSKVQDWVEF